MSTYTELKGLRVKFLAANPDPGAAGDVWYDSAAYALKAFVGRAAWSAGSPLSTKRRDVKGAGTQTAGLAGGGTDAPPITYLVATEEYNEQHNKKNLFFMSFHPSNPATEEEQKFLVSPNNDINVPGPDYKYSMMLVQKFSQLQEASDKLHKQGYYKQWPDEYYQDVVVSRANKYKQINGGLS